MMIDLALAGDAPVVMTGVAAATCLTLAPAFRTRQTILLWQLAAGVFFAAHYFSLGVVVAAWVNILGAVQTCAALPSANSASMNWLGYALICLMALVGLYFWQGPVSSASVAAMTLIALGRMQSDEFRLRALVLGGRCFWILHDFAVNAWIALAADIGAAVTGGVVLLSLLFRVTVEWRPTSAALAHPAKAG